MTNLENAINLGMEHLEANPNATIEENEELINKIEALRQIDIESKNFNDIAL